MGHNSAYFHHIFHLVTVHVFFSKLPHKTNMPNFSAVLVPAIIPLVLGIHSLLLGLHPCYAQGLGTGEAKPS